MALIRISLLTMFRALKVQEVSWDSSLSRRSCQEECLRIESIRGAPRYLEGRVAMGNPKIRATTVLTTGRVWKKKIYDLELLMPVPEASKKSLSRAFKWEASRTDG